MPNIPPTVTTSGTVQLFLVDPVTDQLVAAVPGTVLKLTSPTRIRMTVPPYYSNFYPTNSTAVCFALVFTFPTNQTFVFECRAISEFFLGYDILSSVVPVNAADDDDFVDA